MELSKSAKLSQERYGLRATRRHPGPRFNPSQNLVHTVPLAPPYPTIQVLLTEGASPPDAGRTQIWPHGS